MENEVGMADSSLVKVTSIVIYPIKSCRGISVSQAPISSTGFRWDRQWMIIKPNGRMYTQRVEPRLALVEIELPEEAFHHDWEPTDSSHMAVKAPGMNPLEVELTKSGPMVEGVGVWRWTGSAMDQGEEAAQWFSSYIGQTARFVRFDSGTITRGVDPDFAPGYKTMFADGFPFLVASQESIDALNKLLPNPVSVNRFRPNILVEGCEPFEEDLWKEIRINKSTFYGVKMCPRCKIPGIDQETAVVGPEVPEVMKTFRSDKVLRPNQKHQGHVYFGNYLVCIDSMTGEKGKLISVGDSVSVNQKYNSTDDAPAHI